MEKFLNISNHVLTKEQINNLQDSFDWNLEIVELPKKLKKAWGNLTPNNYEDVCDEIIDYMLKEDICYAHLAGFTPAVVYINIAAQYASEEGVCFYYSFSERVSEEKEINGEIVKTSVFKHRGWYEY